MQTTTTIGLDIAKSVFPGSFRTCNKLHILAMTFLTAIFHTFLYVPHRKRKGKLYEKATVD